MSELKEAIHELVSPKEVDRLFGNLQKMAEYAALECFKAGVECKHANTIREYLNWLDSDKGEFVFKETALPPFDADRITLDKWEEGIFPCRKKSPIIHALQLNFPEGFKVTTKDGVLLGKRGDYLMFGVER